MTKRLLYGLVFCVFLYLVGLFLVSSQYVSREVHRPPRRIASPEPSPTTTPSAWIELQRVPSPEIPFDAVLVHRASAPYESWSVEEEYRVYILARDAQLANETAFPATDLEYFEQASKECVFLAFGLDNPSVRWKYGDQLVIKPNRDNRRVSSFHRLDTFFVEFEGAEKLVLVEYLTGK